MAEQEALSLLVSLSLDEMLLMLLDPDLRDNHELLFSLVSNHIAEKADSLTEAQVCNVIDLSLSKITVGAPSSGSKAEGGQDVDMTRLCLIVLCNLTTVERHIPALLDLTISNKSNPLLASRMRGLLDHFLAYNPQAEEPDSASYTAEKWSEVDPYEHVGSIICNISTLDVGRQVILQRSLGYVPKLAAQIRSRNTVRRRGAVAALRACLFDSDHHWWMLYEIHILSALLLPLVAPTPFTESEKKGLDPLLWMAAESSPTPETDIDIVKMLIESILLLCQRRGLREELRKRKVYPVLRNLDNFLENEDVNLVVQDVVDLLIRDEEVLPDSLAEKERPPVEYRAVQGSESSTAVHVTLNDDPDGVD